MLAKDVIRTEKDSAYGLQITKEQRAMLPETPAEAVELNDADLDAIVGAGFLFDS